MRRAAAPLLLALTIVGSLLAQSVPTPGPTTRYSRLYVFGDSYSDIGAGYIDGNGPTAVAYLGWLMGLQVASSKTASAAGKSLVFAVSGAGTGEGTGRQVKDALLGYGMMNQVRDFAARVKAGEMTFDPQTTLFFLPADSTMDGGTPRSRSPISGRSSRCFVSSAGGTSRLRYCQRRSRSSLPWGFD